MRIRNFETLHLLLKGSLVHSLLSGHNRVHQVYVPRESTPEMLYRWRKLGHKIAGFAASEDLPSQCLLQQRALYSKLRI